MTQRGKPFPQYVNERALTTGGPTTTFSVVEGVNGRQFDYDSLVTTLTNTLAALYALKSGTTFTGNVIVPAADSLGEPIAYGQDGARLNGLTSSGMLIVAGGTTPIQFDGAGVRSADILDISGTDFALRKFDASGTAIPAQIILKRNGDIVILSATSLDMRNAGNVYVPSANAAGEALAYDQAGARLASLSVTGQIGIDGGYAILYMKNTAAPVDEKVYKFVVPPDGNLYFQVYNDTEASSYTYASFYRTGTGGGTFNLWSRVYIATDATGDGEPIIYDQANARLQSLVLSEPANAQLTFDSTGVGQIVFQGGGIIRARIVFADADNNLALQTFNAAGSYSRTPFQIDADESIVNMTDAVAVAVPAATVATHAAQVSAIDAVTGRLAIGGVEMGSTGWRNISTAFKAALNAASAKFVTTGAAFDVYIRRDGKQVTLSVYDNFQTDGTAFNQVVANLIPAGFRPSGGLWEAYWEAGLITDRGTSTVVGKFLVNLSNGEAEFDMTVANDPNTGFKASWISTAAWPTSLPGSQSTAPFTG